MKKTKTDVAFRLIHHSYFIIHNSLSSSLIQLRHRLRHGVNVAVDLHAGPDGGRSCLPCRSGTSPAGCPSTSCRTCSSPPTRRTSRRRRGPRPRGAETAARTSPRTSDATRRESALMPRMRRVLRRERLQIVAKLAGLLGAAGGVVLGIEIEDDVLLALELTEFDLPRGKCRQVKCRGLGTDLWGGHGKLLSRGY